MKMKNEVSKTDRIYFWIFSLTAIGITSLLCFIAIQITQMEEPQMVKIIIIHEQEKQTDVQSQNEKIEVEVEADNEYIIDLSDTATDIEEDLADRDDGLGELKNYDDTIDLQNISEGLL